jgi:hypothetical protein
MSWEVLLLRLPDHVTSMEDLRDDEDTPPLGRKPWVLDAVRRALPESDLTDPTRGQVEGPGWSIELIFGSIDPVDSIMLQVRGSYDDALAPIFRLAAELGCSVLDVFPGKLISPLDEAFQEFRDRSTGAE